MSSYRKLCWCISNAIAPEQIRVVAVADKFEKYADKIKNELVSKWYRAKVDITNDSFSKKIRNGELEKIPYTFIVWEKEETDSIISRRSYASKEQGTCSVDAFLKNLD